MCFLDAEPFRSILNARLDELNEKEYVLDPNAQLCEEVGIGERIVRRLVRGEQPTVSFDHADKIVTKILGPMAWHEDEDLHQIYSSIDLTLLDWAFPVSETVKRELRETAVRFIKELGNSALAAQALGISVGTVGRYAREARAEA
jgi:hypothetical protein